MKIQMIFKFIIDFKEIFQNYTKSKIWVVIVLAT